MDLISLASRALSDAEILLWNQIIHSWVDPIFILATAFAAVVLVVRWIFKA